MAQIPATLYHHDGLALPGRRGLGGFPVRSGDLRTRSPTSTKFGLYLGICPAGHAYRICRDRSVDK